MIYVKRIKTQRRRFQRRLEETSSKWKIPCHGRKGLKVFCKSNLGYSTLSFLRPFGRSLYYLGII